MDAVGARGDAAPEPHTASAHISQYIPCTVHHSSCCIVCACVCVLQVMPQIARALTAAVLLAREGDPLEMHKRLQARGKRYRRVLLLSPDFIVDEAGRADADERSRVGGDVRARFGEGGQGGG